MSVCELTPLMIENPSFHKHLRSFRPRYQPPTGDSIYNTYVDALYKTDCETLSTELSGQKALVTADCSEDAARRNVMHELAIGHFGIRLIDVHYSKPSIKFGAVEIYEQLISTKDSFAQECKVIYKTLACLLDDENTEKAGACLFV